MRLISEKLNFELNVGLGYGVIYKKFEDIGVVFDEGLLWDYYLD